MTYPSSLILEKATRKQYAIEANSSRTISLTNQGERGGGLLLVRGPNTTSIGLYVLGWRSGQTVDVNTIFEKGTNWSISASTLSLTITNTIAYSSVASLIPFID